MLYIILDGADRLSNYKYSVITYLAVCPEFAVNRRIESATTDKPAMPPELRLNAAVRFTQPSDRHPSQLKRDCETEISSSVVRRSLEILRFRLYCSRLHTLK